MYDFVKSVLFAFDPESVHDKSLYSMSWADMVLPAGEKEFNNSSLAVDLCGIHFPNPIGLAAGFDKNAVATRAMAALGFGFVEVGTVTPWKQEGNERPRIFRLKEDRSVVNRMGFPSAGIEAVVENLKRRTRKIPVGVNVGPNKEMVRQQKEVVATALFSCIHKAHAYADYFTLNLSSPNTPGLRHLGSAEYLAELYGKIRQRMDTVGYEQPLFVKLSPDLDSTQIAEIADAANSAKIAALISTNTTISRDALKHDPHEAGGLSGAALKEKSRQFLEELVPNLNKDVKIISAGGISSAQEAYERIKLGASLVQIYTGLIYEGPLLVRQMLHEMQDLLDKDGFDSLEKASGAEL